MPNNAKISYYNNLPGLYPEKFKVYINPGNNNKTWKATQDNSGNILSETVSRNSRPQTNISVDKNYNRQERLVMNHKYKGPLNPLKQWRRQLAPQGGSNSTRSTVSQSMEYPGGTTHLEKKYIASDCSSCGPLLTTYLKENPAVNDCSNCIVIRNQLSNFQPVTLNNPQRITRPRSSQTKLNKNYYTTGTAYLRSRVKLYDQNQLLSAIPGNTYAWNSPEYKNSEGAIDKIHPGAGQGHNPSMYVPPSNSLITGSQAFHSTNCISDPSACCSINLDGSFCATYVTYKPSNLIFNVQGAVSSSTRILDIKRRAIITNNSNFLARKPTGGKRNLSVNGEELPGSTPMLYRGNTVAPYFIKSKYQSIDNLSLIMYNKTRVGSRMPSGGRGIRTVCFQCLG